jgi:hypothetical protein
MLNNLLKLNKRTFCTEVTKGDKFIIYSYHMDGVVNERVKSMADVMGRYYRLKQKHVLNKSNVENTPMTNQSTLMVLANKRPSDLATYYNSILNNIDKLNTWPISFRQAIKTHISGFVTNTIYFDIIFEKEDKKESIGVSMTHPEYLAGVTFLCIDKDTNLAKLINPNTTSEDYLVPTGIYAINPLNNEKIQLIITNVGNDYRTGVPGHNDGDFKLAKKYGFPIRFVIKPLKDLRNTLVEQQNIDTRSIPNIGSQSSLLSPRVDKIRLDDIKQPLILTNDEGFLVNSKEFDFLFIQEARELIVKYLEKNGKASKRVTVEGGPLDIKEFIDLVNPPDGQLTEDYLRTLFPVDICITTIKGYKNILNITVLYQYMLHEYLKIDVASRMKQLDFEEVITSKDQELERDFCIPYPFKEVIVIHDQEDLDNNQNNHDNQALSLLASGSKSAINSFHNTYEELYKLIMSSNLFDSFDIEKVVEEYKQCNTDYALIVPILQAYEEVYENYDNREIGKCFNVLEKA